MTYAGLLPSDLEDIQDLCANNFILIEKGMTLTDRDIKHLECLQKAVSSKNDDSFTESISFLQKFKLKFELEYFYENHKSCMLQMLETKLLSIC